MELSNLLINWPKKRKMAKKKEEEEEEEEEEEYCSLWFSVILTVLHVCVRK